MAENRPADPTAAPRPVVPVARTNAPSTRPVASLLNNRRPQDAPRIPPALQAKMAAMANRGQNAGAKAVDSATAALIQATLRDGPGSPRAPVSSPGPAQRAGHLPAGNLAKRRPNLNIPKLSPNDVPGGMHLPPIVGGGPSGAGLGSGRPVVGEPPRRLPPMQSGTPFSNFSKIVDPSGALNFSGKAVLHASGVNFSNGASFAISIDQLQLEDELGKGAYGTVKRVLHKPTNVAMAMKEIRLELDEAKLNAIIMELDILHRAVAPEIVEFYGAFFIESCVYYCMEYMDAGSLDKLQGQGLPEHVLARVTGAMVRGLKFLKDDLQIIHRDVKPTNVLVNRKGQIKLCDFGVSGQLEKSLAKTNIGCQSYMAPERIQGESQNNLGTYSVSSDVWSLGLSMIEMAIGRYPYPPETYANVFAQLSAIVHGDPPELPDHFSGESKDFVARCLHKVPNMRATYAELLNHPFLVHDRERQVDMPAWVAQAIDYREREKQEKLAKQDGHDMPQA